MKFVFSILIALFIVACSSGSGSKEPASSTPTSSPSATTKKASSNPAGEKLFKMKCAACHKPDKKLIGPPLKGVLAEHWDNNKADLYLYVRNWQDANDKGIARAVEIEDYDPSVMTPFPELTDAQLDDIFDYIEKY
ncbi:MAG: cytochrome c [Saprospiraceae bacterium]|nr:cytochrome c [Saprospiraceae bacterium]